MATGRKKKKTGARKGWPRLEAREVLTPYHYEHAWQLILSGYKPDAIASSVGVTRAQLVHLLEVGLPDHELAPLKDRFVSHVMETRRKGMEMAAKLGADTIEWATEQVSIAKRCQQYLKLILQHTAAPFVEAMRTAAGSTPPAVQAPGSGTVAFIRLLYDMSNHEPIVDAFRKCFDNPSKIVDDISGLPKGERMNFSPEEKFILALTSPVDDGEKKDILSVLPETENWTDEDFERFAKTGERPERDYGRTH